MSYYDFYMSDDTLPKLPKGYKSKRRPGKFLVICSPTGKRFVLAKFPDTLYPIIYRNRNTITCDFEKGKPLIKKETHCSGARLTKFDRHVVVRCLVNYLIEYDGQKGIWPRQTSVYKVLIKLGGKLIHAPRL